MIWFLLILAIVIAAPFAREAMKPQMDDTLRQSAPGEFVQLSRGLTHYQWFGGARGPVAVRSAM